MGQITVHQTAENEQALVAFITDYIGPQKGFSPAGSGTRPLVFRLADGSSASPLIEEVTRGLSLDVDFRPEKMTFLTAITVDISFLSSVVPPFYKVMVHVSVTNPLPQTIQVHQLNLTATHLNLKGPTLYHYSRTITEPMFDPTRYILGPFETKTLDFELNVLSEVSWGFLFSPSEILQLLWEAQERNVTVGISLNLIVKIKDGYFQKIHYDNDALSGQLCFHATPPKQNCGGLPPMFQPSELLAGRTWRSQPRVSII